MKTILVALDGSRSSMAALPVAADWAVKLDANLRGLFVEDEHRFFYYPGASSFEGGLAVPMPLPAGALEEVELSVKAEGEEIREAFEEVVQQTGCRGALSVVRGNVVELLTAAARASDLVVAGRRGKRPAGGNGMPGVTAEALIHDALRPVLIVPEEPRTKGPALFAYDGSIGVQRVVVPGSQMAAARGEKVVVITVENDLQKGAALQSTLKEYLEPHGLEAEYLVKPGKPSPVIIQTAKEIQAGMIVTGAFGHGQIRQILFGSTTLDLLQHSPCPVLLMV